MANIKSLTAAVGFLSNNVYGGPLLGIYNRYLLVFKYLAFSEKLMSCNNGLKDVHSGSIAQHMRYLVTIKLYAGEG